MKAIWDRKKDEFKQKKTKESKMDEKKRKQPDGLKKGEKNGLEKISTQDPWRPSSQSIKNGSEDDNNEATATKAMTPTTPRQRRKLKNVACPLVDKEKKMLSTKESHQ